MASYKVIGMMSGTSLDGLDIAFVDFQLVNSKWTFNVLHTDTYEYPKYLRERLSSAVSLDARELVKTDHWFGGFLGELCKDFIEEYKLEPDLVVSHGQTMFHEPQLGYTLQIGHGADLKKHLQCPLVYDLRSMDVSLGGQGAPLVPGGEFELFPNYDAFLNLGGFSNISMKNSEVIRAYDISPVNIVLNRLANSLGKAYDESGEMAREGEFDQMVYEALNKLEYYASDPPKSIGIEWVDQEIWPILSSSNHKSALRSFTEHTAFQIGRSIDKTRASSLLLSGGGCFNKFLIERIRANCSTELNIASESIINFKEAIVFAFLGLKRLRLEINCLASVTGARRDSIGGILIP